MSMPIISGQCLCGQITYEVEDDFQEFYFCHCIQCRQQSGSAHVANLFTHTDNINWKTGEALLKRFDYPNRQFSNVFCTNCGSNMPYVSKSGKSLIVPAGTLLSEPTKMPSCNIFCGEQTNWYWQGLDTERKAGEP